MERNQALVSTLIRMIPDGTERVRKLVITEHEFLGLTEEDIAEITESADAFDRGVVSDVLYEQQRAYASRILMGRGM